MADQIRTASNTPGANMSPSALEDAIMVLLPASIANWLRYDAPCNFDVRDIYRAHAAGMSEERILESMKGEARVQTMRSYGDMHPQLPYAKREFDMGRNPYANQNDPVRRAA